MQIIDYVIIGIAVLFLGIGLFRGMVKMTFGLLAGLASLIIAIMLCTTVAGAVVSGTGLGKQLGGAISGSVNIGTNDILVYQQSGETDKLGFYAPNAEGVNEFKELSTLFEGNVFLQILSGPIEGGIRSIYSKEASVSDPLTASVAISMWAAVIIIQIITFILLWIVLAVLFKVVSILLKKFVSATFVGHFLDRALGGVEGVAIAWLLIMVVFTVIGLMQSMEFMKPVVDHISSSLIGKFIYDNNFLYQLLTANVDFGSILPGAQSAAAMALTL